MLKSMLYKSLRNTYLFPGP